MYSIRTEQSFDSAHFLAGYEGKCRNLHGHRWRVVVEVGALTLREEGQLRGMISDFGDLKRDVRELTDYYDHAFIYEKNSLRMKTVQALEEEGFRLVEVPFRPTAENFAAHFYRFLEQKGYEVRSVAVYETPDNCAVYTGDEMR
ncbi:MAG: 6-carboxytetrahydropterin synthase QueD [Clostridiales bacterium]|nr:6-carboxytetrahydropterin synthase QueD [Clostridiales bacterium]